MVRISKKKLTKKQERALQNLLINIFAKQQDTCSIAQLLEELLTDIEYSALANRLAAIALLDAGQSYYSIRKSLGIGIDTQKRLENKLKNGSINTIKRTLRGISTYKPTNKTRTIKGSGPIRKDKAPAMVKAIDNILDILPYYGESITGYRYRKLHK